MSSSKWILWLWHKLLDKINIVGAVKATIQEGMKYGPRFVVAAVAWEIFEDVGCPLLSWWFGHPELIPLFLVLHFEVIVWPIFFWAFRTWDRIRGREPWDPLRPRVSTHSRSWAKVVTHRLMSAAIFWVILARFALPLWLLTAYMLVMTGFKYVHERIWHDSSWGISRDGVHVFAKRVLAKATTYRIVSTIVVGMAFQALLGSLHWEALITYQLIAFVAFMAIEATWARSQWGIRARNTA